MAQVKGREVTVSMSDFALGSDTGEIVDKEQRRAFIMKANAKASMEIKASAKIRKNAPDRKDVEEYIDKVKMTVDNDAIPLEIYLDVFTKNIRDKEAKRDRLYNLRKRNRGFLGKADKAQLERLEQTIQSLKLEKEDFIKEYEANKKSKKNNSLNLVTPSTKTKAVKEAEDVQETENIDSEDVEG